MLWFGPDWWKADALVTGFSRGKLYRTKLAKVAGGYVAQNQLIGSTNMMPSDMCVGPNSSVVVAMHSGGPDWGTGPAGIGKLHEWFGATVPTWSGGAYKISQYNKDVE